MNAATFSSDDNVIRIHQCISGFTQSGRRMHGVFQLSERLHELGYNNTVSRVSLLPWNADWTEVAESIWLLTQLHKTAALVNIYGYSYGGGHGAISLAKELGERGIGINTMVLSDAVHRPANPLTRWRALLRRDQIFAPTIEIPDKVTRVVPFHQTLNVPQGHRIKPSKGFSGILEESRELHRTHQYMDDASSFHNACITAAHALQQVTL